MEKMVKYYFSEVGKHSIDKVIFFLEGKKQNGDEIN